MLTVRRALIILALVAVAAVAGAACSSGGGGDEGDFAQPVDEPGDRSEAPQFSVPLLDGEGELTTADLAGTPVVLNFWASWCGPCRAETPALVEFSEQNPGVRVVGVAVDDDPADSRRFAGEFDVPYELASDRQGTEAAKFGVQGLPVTVILDDQGRVVTTWFGEITGDDLDLFVEQLGTSEEAPAPTS